MAGLISRVAISSKETILNLNLWTLNRKQIKGCVGIAGLDSSDDLCGELRKPCGCRWVNFRARACFKVIKKEKKIFKIFEIFT